MKLISRTITAYEYTVIAVTHTPEGVVSEVVERGESFDNVKENAIIKAYRAEHPEEKRAIVVSLHDGVDATFSMPVDKFVQHSKRTDKTYETVPSDI